MNERSLVKLEFNKIKDAVKARAISGAGKELVEQLSPLPNVGLVRRALAEVQCAQTLIAAKGAAPFEGVFDVRDEIKRAGKGAQLTAGALLKIGNLMRSARLFEKYLKMEEDPLEALQDLASGIRPLRNLENEISRCILSEEEVADAASPKLAGLRRSIRDKSSSVKDKVQNLVRSNEKYLQENLYTVRGDRYVIPVKAEHKSQVPGLVHDQSATGQTLYIEPLSLVNLNNEIRELMLAEKTEVDRILRELSQLVYQDVDAVRQNAIIVYALDSVFARARYAEATYSCVPEVKEDHTFSLISARHPLIDERKVVPSTVYLGEEATSIIITGPNTGGKTVTLKTIGLLHAMALSGIPIPANEGSQVAFFDEIYADIGDEQSIEQSLSTFSSHMTNIVAIMEQADDNSLVLFDELGAGTDPTEGAALAMAILEELRSRNSRVVATTHYSELKAYALRTPGVINASVEFDVNSLKPTYRLIIGIPGKSNAFLISRRLGLPQDIIDSAKNLLAEDSLQFEDLIEKLQKSSLSAREDAQKSEALRRSAEEKDAKLQRELANIENQKQKELDEARREARALLRQVKEEADDILKSLRQMDGSSSGDLRRELEKNRQRLRDTLDKLDEAEQADQASAGLNKKQVSEGIEVRHEGIGQTVQVLTLPDNKGDLMVQAGIMKIKANLKDLALGKGQPKKRKAKKTVSLNLSQVASSIDLRGLDGEEAAYRCDQYLDEAARGGLGEVTIIHGVGTGVLKNRINQLLKKHPHIKSSRPGAYGEGGMGVTIAELK